MQLVYVRIYKNLKGTWQPSQMYSNYSPVAQKVKCGLVSNNPECIGHSFKFLKDVRLAENLSTRGFGMG